MPLQQKQPVGSLLLHVLILHSVEKRIIKADSDLWKNKGRKLLGEAATSISCCHVVLAQSPTPQSQSPSPPSFGYRSRVQWFSHSCSSSPETRVALVVDQQSNRQKKRSLVAWKERLLMINELGLPAIFPCRHLNQ